MTEAEIIDKLLNDATYGINTHFAAQEERHEALRKQVELQNQVIKAIWKKVKILEQKP